MGESQKIRGMGMHHDMVIRIDFKPRSMAHQMGIDFAGKAAVSFETVDDMGQLPIVGDSDDANIVGGVGFSVPEISSGSGKGIDAVAKNGIGDQREGDIAKELCSAVEIFVDLVLIEENRNVTTVSLIPAKAIHIIDNVKVIDEFRA